MTRFGFVLDQRSCIGCHACTVACKQEHGVELGVFRTWVRYIERGTFPDTRRRPIWLFRPVKPVLDAYALPQDERTRAGRLAADQFAEAVNWDPAEVWGPMPGTFEREESAASAAPRR